MSYTHEDFERFLYHAVDLRDSDALMKAVAYVTQLEEFISNVSRYNTFLEQDNDRLAKAEDLWREEARQATTNRDYWRDRCEKAEQENERLWRESSCPVFGAEDVCTQADRLAVAEKVCEAAKQLNDAMHAPEVYELDEQYEQMDAALDEWEAQR